MDLDKDNHGVMENGSGTHEELEPDQPESEPDQSALLKKLEEQNRILQEDKRCHTQIMSPSGSIPSLPDSILSTDSTGAAAAIDEHASQTSQQSQDSTSSQQEAEERLEHPVRRFNTKERARSESEITKMSVDSLSEGGLKKLEGGLKKSPAIASLKEESDVKKRDRSQSELTKKSSTLMSEDLSAEVTTGGRGEKQEWSSEEDLWQKWSPLLKNWEESERKSQKLIRQLARQGIPAQLRGMAWQLMAGAHDQELKDKYPVLITKVSPFERQIQRDLTRTFPEHSFFKDRDGLGQESLLNVMKAYSVYDREVGYCQGSPFITGMLLMQQVRGQSAAVTSVVMMMSLSHYC